MIEEAEAPALGSLLARATVTNHGQRGVEGRRLTQAAGEVMPGWMRAG